MLTVCCAIADMEILSREGGMRTKVLTSAIYIYTHTNTPQDALGANPGTGHT